MVHWIWLILTAIISGSLGAILMAIVSTARYFKDW